MDELDDPLIGRIVADRYRIDALIGKGGMGVVYRARQLNIDRDIAVKVLKRDKLGDAPTLERFVREARIISRLKSPHTVTLIDVGEITDGDFFIAMEYLQGQTLRARLADGPLEATEACRIFEQIALGVAEAHAAGVVHRDIKPLNIVLVDTPGRPFVKVLDFGLAAFGDGERGHLAGTPRYVAPELIAGDDATPRADVYAMGVMLYEALSGAPPFESDDVKELLRQHVEKQPPTPRETCPTLALPDDAEALIMRCLAKPPPLRPADATVFRHALLESFGLESFGLESQQSSRSVRESFAPGRSPSPRCRRSCRSRCSMRPAASRCGAGWPWPPPRSRCSPRGSFVPSRHRSRTRAVHRSWWCQPTMHARRPTVSKRTSLLSRSRTW